MLSDSLIEKKQQKMLFLLSFTQLWESFSFYGMRVLLVLYLINHLSYQEEEAFAIYALYISLIEIGAFIGGYCADHFLGLYCTIFLGGFFICFGHLCLIFSAIDYLFFLGLGFIICGSSLFRSNLKALVGLLYQGDDLKRESGFTLFYTCINSGGFAAALLCGYTAQCFGWSVGLSLAAAGMMISLIIFSANFRLIRQLEPKHANYSASNAYLVITLALIACIGCGFLLIYFAVIQLIVLPLAFILLLSLLIYLSSQMNKQ